MILKQKERLDPELKEDLKKYVYDVVGYIMEVYKGLPCGLPELTPNRMQCLSSLKHC